MFVLLTLCLSLTANAGINVDPYVTNLHQRQNRHQVSGLVVDAQNQPVIGAYVLEKGTQNGIPSGVDGGYSLEVGPNATLVVSFMGYATKEVLVGEQTNIIIRLAEEAQQVEEVVVIGYGTISRREVTSAVAHISSKDFHAVGGNNPLMQIQGKVSGVTIGNQAAGDPNSIADVQIRGISSRQSSALGPLIVIDGVPGGNLNNINENDIESIDILKDGAASAIYGTRGSNGVIIVTTKKGTRDGNVNTTYSGYMSIIVPKKELKVLSADEFRQHMPQRGTDFGASTDWFDEITKIGYQQNHTVQVSGGNNRNSYRASIDVRDSEGIDLRSARQEIGARFTINHTTKSDLLRFTFNLAPRVADFTGLSNLTNANARANSADTDYAVFWQALTLNPTFPVKDPNDPDMYYEATGWEAQNPVERLLLEKNGGKMKFLDWDGTVRLNLLPLFNPTDTRHTLSTQVTFSQQLNDRASYWFRPSTSTLAIKNNYKGEARQDYHRNIQNNFQWLANYNYNSNGHNLGVMTGYEYNYFQTTRLWAENKDFTSDQLTYNDLGNGTYLSETEGRVGMDSSKEDSKLIAFFGRLSYDYQGKYMATAGFRYEGSSKFGANHKWGFFPNISAGWMISEEGFMENISWITELKLRADYGVAGNQNFGPYRSLTTYGGYGQVYYDGRYYTGWSPNRNPNPDLKWEMNKAWNVGVDFILFKNVLSGSINYYSRTQQDLLGDYDVPVPPSIATSIYANVGTMRNSGLEFDFDIAAVNRPNFNYDISILGSWENNKFMHFSNDTYRAATYLDQSGFPAPGSPGSVQRIEEGKRVGGFWTYEYAGVDDSGNWNVYNEDGDVIPIGQADDSDKRYVGNGLPKYKLSMTHSFRYKNLDWSLFFRGYFGYQVYDVHNFYWGLQSAAPNLNVMHTAYKENAHIVAGMNQHNSYFVKDADHLKLEVFNIGYSINVGNKWLESIRVYFTGRNLFTITGYKGVDLDVFPVTGLEPGVPPGKKSYYPSSRQYLFGLELNF